MIRSTRLSACLAGVAVLIAFNPLSGNAQAPATPATPAEPAAPADVKAPPADAETTASGLASKVLQKGTGTVHPTAADKVTTHYSGWTTDGKLFDSSVVRGKPLTFSLGQVIAGWKEGIQLMVEGEKRRFWIPAKLAYGENPGGGRPGGMLVFDVELISVQQAAKPAQPAAPAPQP
jgi:FKBP-type peptidyl-prolyl cis-trans isomerase